MAKHYTRRKQKLKRFRGGATVQNRIREIENKIKKKQENQINNQLQPLNITFGHTQNNQPNIVTPQQTQQGNNIKYVVKNHIKKNTVKAVKQRPNSQIVTTDIINKYNKHKRTSQTLTVPLISSKLQVYTQKNTPSRRASVVQLQT